MFLAFNISRAPLCGYGLVKGVVGNELLITFENPNLKNDLVFNVKWSSWRTQFLSLHHLSSRSRSHGSVMLNSHFPDILIGSGLNTCPRPRQGE